jgi:predicted transcriptional regulator of viral defense system
LRNPSATGDEILAFARAHGVLRPRDLQAAGFRREALRRLCRSGQIHRIGRGLYMLPDAEVTEHHSLVEAAKRVPHGVVCLLSALQFHRMTTQAPFEVWLAIDRRARPPRPDVLPLRIVRFSGESLHAGVEEHCLEGVPVRIYSTAKTVADCFKYRNKIGLDVALEALRDYLRQRRGTIDELWECAEICRVARVVRPYLEALV